MKKILCLTLLVPVLAVAEMKTPSPLLLLLASATQEASDAQLTLGAGFVQCDPALALTRADLEPRGVRFAVPGSVQAPPGVSSAAVMRLKPQTRLSQMAADGSGYLVADATYPLARPVSLPGSPVRVISAGEAAYYQPQPSTVSITLRFDRSVDEAVRALDARFDGAVSRRLGESHASSHLWFVAQDNHTLTCYRQPDLQVAP
ncbi:hypothetical protein IQ289_31495 [Burkholderia sp. R-70006]|uniref:hypothetical protein n=1 Tax=Paraburkholderia domus TaxID=2793075 RepID=UPI001911B829|nr:hypothetical protein [Paraburkholderia domus]MBK5052910.1 hypothetical protein [Burkholderia sp. R-70006]